MLGSYYVGEMFLNRNNHWTLINVLNGFYMNLNHNKSQKIDFIFHSLGLHIRIGSYKLVPGWIVYNFVCSTGTSSPLWFYLFIRLIQSKTVLQCRLLRQWCICIYIYKKYVCVYNYFSIYSIIYRRLLRKSCRNFGSSTLPQVTDTHKQVMWMLKTLDKTETICPVFKLNHLVHC